MTEFFVFLVYFGGIGPTYRKSRGAGNGRAEAFFDALAWPAGLGRFIARFWEDA